MKTRKGMLKMNNIYQGLLIINGFLNSNKFSEQRQWLINAANEKKINLVVKTNSKILAYLDSDNLEESYVNNYGAIPDFVLFWDKDIRLAMYFELMGIPVFNSSAAIAQCDDKSMTHLLLVKHGIPMPKTVFAPMTFDNVGYNNFDFLEIVKQKLNFPMIVKECF